MVKGSRQLRCVAVYLEIGIELRLMDAEDFHRTALLKDRPTVQERAEAWRNMTLESTSSTATSIDAIQRKLIIGIVVATLLTLAVVIADLAIGGRPDPPALRAAATLLDGAWRFHTGDDPHWADPNSDDNAWETVDMLASRIVGRSGDRLRGLGRM